MSRPGPTDGAAIAVEALAAAGVEVAFGLPGTRLTHLYEALRRSRLRTVLATHELAAAFMANGYYRACGRPAALLTIGGPGLTFALTGLAQAAADSVGLVCIADRRAGGRPFALQSIDQAAVAAPATKAIVEVHSADRLRSAIGHACRLAVSGEPGPVLVQVDAELLAAAAEPNAPLEPSHEPPASVPAAVLQAIQSAERPALFVGQGTLHAAPALRQLAERMRAPVAATPSARGVLPEDHHLVVRWDSGAAVEVLNELLAASDLVLAIGCKLTHTGTAGFNLALPADRLVHVDASPDVLGANYPAQHHVVMDAGTFIQHALGAASAREPHLGWPAAALADLRGRAAEHHHPRPLEPRFSDLEPPDARGFFGGLRRALPPEGVLVTDSGLHQILARRHFPVMSPRGLILPSDYQSMAFALPAAIGARIAAPDRPIVALLGDGGLAMSGLELLTAVRERIPLTVVVFNDGALGIIRLEQITTHGRPFATALHNPDLELLAHACGAAYALVEGDPEPTLRRAIASRGVTLLEVRLGEAPTQRRMRLRGAARDYALRVLGHRAVHGLRRVLRRRAR